MSIQSEMKIKLTELSIGGVAQAQEPKFLSENGSLNSYKETFGYHKCNKHDLKLL